MKKILAAVLAAVICGTLASHNPDKTIDNMKNIIKQSAEQSAEEQTTAYTGGIVDEAVSSGIARMTGSNKQDGTGRHINNKKNNRRKRPVKETILDGAIEAALPHCAPVGIISKKLSLFDNNSDGVKKGKNLPAFDSDRG